MKAVTGELPPPGDGWAAELKFDGQRLVAAVGDPDQPLRLDTTTGADAVARFPELGGLTAALAPHRLVVDGEVVALDADGRPDFSLLQHRMHLSRPVEIVRVAERIPVHYMVFDLLWLDGEDLTGRRYLERRELLASTVAPGASWSVPAHHVGGAADLFAAAQAQRLEGIVAKQVDSRYLPGARSPLWRKIKVRPQQEFVIGGWHEGEGGRSGQLGALLVGVYDDGRLRYSGMVGTGFDGAELTRLGGLLAAVASGECPFDPPPPKPVSRVAQWVRPELVAEVTFAEWTPAGTLRHPSYLATREDKDPRTVVREG
jgi:bifunctional non-homologous end joining protein LigD